MNTAFIIKRPVITEKSLKQASRGVFTFQVAKSANKDQVKRAVEQAFAVKVTEVNTTVLPARRYKAGKRRQERQGVATKKASVQLLPGQKIDLFDIEKE